MRTRTRSALLLAVLLSVTAALVAPSQPQAARPARPNVLLFLLDDWSINDSPQVMSKAMRWFRGGGTEFPNYFVATPLCCPSRSEMYSGRFSHNNGVVDNTGDRHIDFAASLQRYLRDGGYQSALVGKTVMGWPLSRPFPYFTWQARTLEGYHDSLWNVDGSTVRAPYTTTFTRDQALRYLDTKLLPHSSPWFLLVTPHAPHLPFEPEDRYRDAPVGSLPRTPAMAEADRRDKPPYVQRLHVTYQQMAPQWVEKQRVLKSADDMIDAVMSRLAANNELSNVIAILTSDNGYLMSEHGLQKKTVPYQQSVRVPFLIRWPGRYQAGGRDSRLVSNIDLLPSLLAMTATQPARLGYPLDGRAYLDPRFSGPSRSALLLEQHTSPDFRYVPPWASMRGRDYQYVEYYASDAPGAAVVFREYYNMARDPHQLYNLLAESPPALPPPSAATLAALHTRLTAARACKGAACP